MCKLHVCVCVFFGVFWKMWCFTSDVVCKSLSYHDRQLGHSQRGATVQKKPSSLQPEKKSKEKR